MKKSKEIISGTPSFGKSLVAVWCFFYATTANQNNAMLLHVFPYIKAFLESSLHSTKCRT